MKLRDGDMLIMNDQNGTVSLQLIGRDDVPRVEKEGYGWNDGATAWLKGTDMAEFLDTISGCAGHRTIGEDGLVVSIEWDDLSDNTYLVLSVKSVSVRLTWSERALLLYAIRSIAWRMFK